MKIKYYGNTCFLIEEKGFKVAMNPQAKLSGVSVDVTTASLESTYENLGDARCFNWPGEYETQGVHFKGIAAPNKTDEKAFLSTVFKIHFKGVRIAHLGEAGNILDDDALEALGDVDVLLVPVNSNTDLKSLKKMVEEIEPRLIIPMGYADVDGNVDQSTLNGFLSTIGTPNVETLDEYTFKKSELPDDSSKLIVLNVL